MEKRALLVSSDGDWEGLWIDKKLYCQYHSINQGEDRGLFFLKLSEKYKLKYDDFQEAEANSDADEYLNLGGFPEEYEKIITMIDF